jgi:hypothetical protein
MHRNELKILADRYLSVMLAWKLRRLVLQEITTHYTD